MLLLLDNYDSFTYNLVDYFSQLGVVCDVVKNDVVAEEIISREYQAIVISPGPETPEKAGNLMTLLEYYHKKIPVLGICLGHQAIGQFFGAKLVKAAKPMHGKCCTVTLVEDPLFRDIPPSINVVRYNSLLLEEPRNELAVIGLSVMQEVMAIRHKTLPIYGLQFHPEAALTEYGLQMLQNWLDCHNIGG